MDGLSIICLSSIYTHKHCTYLCKTIEKESKNFLQIRKEKKKDNENKKRKESNKRRLKNKKQNRILRRKKMTRKINKKDNREREENERSVNFSY